MINYKLSQVQIIRIKQFENENYYGKEFLNDKFHDLKYMLFNMNPNNVCVLGKPRDT